MRNSEKTISANSKGIVIYYGDNKKHMFASYQNDYVKKVQIEGTTKYQSLESFNFNERQEKIYSKLVYGLEAYSELEIKKLSTKLKKRIIVNYTITQKLLNRWKQEIINEMVDGFLCRMFPKSKAAKQMVSQKGYDDNIECTISFRELGVSDKSIANKLIEFGLLPKNFFNLV
jgi:hypothetical protein